MAWKKNFEHRATKRSRFVPTTVGVKYFSSFSMTPSIFRINPNTPHRIRENSRTRSVSDSEPNNVTPMVAYMVKMPNQRPQGVSLIGETVAEDRLRDRGEADAQQRNLMYMLASDGLK